MFKKGSGVCFILGVVVAVAGGCSTTKTVVKEQTTTVTTTVVQRRTPAPSTLPPGLSRFGYLVWNLDALLHDTFGDSTFYLETGSSVNKADFNTQFEGACCSGTYNFTFTRAEHSRFRAITPDAPPQPAIGASGSALPLTVQHKFISCGQEKWLFVHFGNGDANWSIFCISGY